MLRATLVYCFMALYVLMMAPIGMAWTALSGSSVFVYKLARFCVGIAGWLCRVKVAIRNLEKILPGQNYVFLSNHRGNFDGPVLLYVIPRDIRALVKKEMMQIPVLSLVLKQVRCVPIDRSDPVRARSSIDRGAELLKAGYSFIAFPEGTRSRDGRLGSFKKGVFLMALKAGTPIMPITILNSARIQPPGVYWIWPGTIEVIFHDPILTTGMDLEEKDQVMALTRAAIASALPPE